MNESVVKIVNGLRELADSLEGTLKNEINKVQDTSSKVEKVSKKEELKVEPITLEKVRAVLAGLCQAGKQAKVKALIQKYGAEKLTALDPTCYVELLREAEEL